MLSPLPSSPTAPSTWYAAVAAPQVNVVGNARKRVGRVVFTEPVQMLLLPRKNCNDEWIEGGA
jgi:hypothetical protein